MADPQASPPPPPPPAPAPRPRPSFAQYLTSSLLRPFRRYNSSSSRLPPLGNAPSDSVHPRAILARIQPDTIRCSTCGVDFAFSSQIVSRQFTGRHGRAYLVAPLDADPYTSDANLTNVTVGETETRTLSTGLHNVADVRCAHCRARIGWKYMGAAEDEQVYKVGKFLVERKRIVEYRNWDDATTDEVPQLESQIEATQAGHGDDAVEPDLEDSDEMEDLFLGIWDARIATARRKRKRDMLQQQASEPPQVHNSLDNQALY
ncbi:yippee zinc-binding/DNA-binding /Mis18, centromere assembly-domain-containing protein [Astrocystis sublimbata]|nr:yippee zinc-binding/DNA-binding /Mis18, centromere assembly-domain-containing protein [Astrocystis sublimbata]